MEPGLVVLEHLAATLARTFRTPCRIRPETFDVSFALDAGRRQYYSTAILQRLERASDLDARVLGVTACDLYVPVLTFVFGEAQLDGLLGVMLERPLADVVLLLVELDDPGHRGTERGRFRIRVLAHQDVHLLQAQDPLRL